MLAVHLPFVRAATCVLLTHFIHYFLSFVSLRFIHRLSFFASAACCLILATLAKHKHTYCFCKSVGSFHFIFTTLCHSFISVGCSPPAAHNLACLAACPGCGFVMVFEAKHKCLALNKNTFQTLASHCCCLSPLHGSIFSTVAGARSQFQSFLIPLALGGTPLGYSVDKFATQHRFFFSRRRYYLFIISFQLGFSFG